MSSANQSQSNYTVVSNSTVGILYLGYMELVLFSTMISIPCCVFLFINGTMLFTLRSKIVFRETSRYILLFNLLFADTVQMSLGQFLFILNAFRIRVTYPVCGIFTMIACLTNVIPPLTLVVMSLERYVAVCCPLRHSAVVTITNTAVAIIVVWGFSSLNVLTQVILMLDFKFEDLVSLMKDNCARESMRFSSVSDLYDKVFVYFLFVSAGVVIFCSYIGVSIAARSASTDKASARKGRNTLLLHMVQLGLSLCSTIHNPLHLALLKVLDKKIFVRVQIVLYVCIIIFPSCLSSLIYGIRDQTIRPILISNICCQWRCSLSLSVVPAKVKSSMHVTS
ncbi:odorant receptor 131-2-like [Etheostoma spectabile]|uniref:odorant receptor 131-2-like n=1 Tax=Etheostoma spectabile TaxID=54343 RepID=UPI0013AEDE2F|nr:odorant receptor 131-2-like [Etheostoma spectabile]